MATSEQAAPAALETAAAEVLLEQPSHLQVSWFAAVYMIWYRDIVRYTRDRPRLLASFAQPVLYLAIFGVGLSSALGSGFSQGIAGQTGASVSYIQFMYPGVVAMSVLFIAMFSAMSVVWDREFGFLKEILVAPVNPSSVALGKALGGATQAMIQGAIMLILAPFVGVKLTALSVIVVIPLLFVLAFGMTTLGVALATRLKTMQGFQVVMNFLLMPMFFLSGALFPLGAALPVWLRVLT